MTALNDITDSLGNLPDIIERYEAELEGYDVNLEIKGKTIELANREQASWLAFYDERRVEIGSVLKYIDGQLDRIKGTLWKSYTETHSRELGPRDKERYIMKDTAFLDMYELMLEVKEIHDKYVMVVDAFRARGFALRNITDIRVNSLQDAVL